MKTILAPIDFSETSVNAAHYAAKIALCTGARLVLCNIYNLPVSVTDAPGILVDAKEIEDGVRISLQKIANDLHAGYNISVVPVCRLDFPVDGIKTIIKEEHAEMVVAGLNGAGKIEQWLIGSTATSLLKGVDCSVMIIPPACKFKPLKEILIAHDRQSMADINLSVLEELVNYFKPLVHILNVVKYHQMDPILVDIAHEKVLNRLEKFSPEVHFVEREDTIKAIDEYLLENKVDMLVMIPRPHTIIEKLLIGSLTRKMAFHVQVPLFSLSSNKST